MATKKTKPKGYLRKVKVKSYTVTRDVRKLPGRVSKGTTSGGQFKKKRRGGRKKKAPAQGGLFD